MHLSSKLSSNDEQRVKGSNPSFKVTKNRFLKVYERQTQKKEKTQTQSYSAFFIFDYLICIYLFFAKILLIEASLYLLELRFSPRLENLVKTEENQRPSSICS